MDDFLIWAGGGLLGFVVPWMLWDLVIYGPPDADEEESRAAG